MITHTLTLTLGADLESALSPENINGIMMYFGVNNLDDLEKKIAADKYREVRDALKDTGLEIIQGNWNKVDENNFSQNELKTIDEGEAVEESLPEAESNEMTIDQLGFLILEAANKLADKPNASLEGLFVDKSFEGHKKEILLAMERAGLPKEDTYLRFDDLDDKYLVISYLDDGQLKTEAVEPSATKEELNG